MRIVKHVGGISASLYRSEVTSVILPTLEIFIPFEKFKRLNKRKYFVIPTVSHKLHIFVTYKRLIWIQFDPFAHYNIISEVAHNSYNKLFPFGTPFAFLKRNKSFQCDQGCPKSAIIMQQQFWENACVVHHKTSYMGSSKVHWHSDNKINERKTTNFAEIDI